MKERAGINFWLLHKTMLYLFLCVIYFIYIYFILSISMFYLFYVPFVVCSVSSVTISLILHLLLLYHRLGLRVKGRNWFLTSYKIVFISYYFISLILQLYSGLLASQSEINFWLLTKSRLFCGICTRNLTFLPIT